MIKENNQTIDSIVSSESVNNSDSISFRYGRKLDYHDREKIVDLYNKHEDIRVRDISDELNKGRDATKIKKFSTSTLYRILKEYQNNGKTIEWRKNKRKTHKYEKQNKELRGYLSSIINKGYEKTKSFFKRNIKSILSYTLVGVFSFCIGYGMAKDLNNNTENYKKQTNQVEKSIEDKIKPNSEDEKGNYVLASEANNKKTYVLLPDELKLTSEFDRKITYSPQNSFENFQTKDYFLKKGETLWNIMDKETRRPDLWEFAYASNESTGKTKNQISRQEKIRELGIKYNLTSLKNVGKGHLQPYEIGSQYKISNNTKILFDDYFNEDIKKITLKIESEFNRVFYN